MDERGWLWTAVIMGGIVLGVIWAKQDQTKNAVLPGWVPGQQLPPGAVMPPGQQPATQYEMWLRQSKESGKQMVVYFGRADCPPCQRMKSEVFPNAGVQSALSKYIFCVVDVNQEPALTQKYGVTVLPTYFIVDSNEKVLKQATGYMAAGQFTQWLGGQVAPPSQADPPRNQQPQQPPRRRIGPQAQPNPQGPGGC